MEAPAEADVVEWEEGAEAAGPLPLQTLEVRRSQVFARTPAPSPNRRRASFEAPPHPVPESSASFLRPPPDTRPLFRAQEHGVAASDIKKLLEAGIHTVEGLAHASKKSLKDIKGLSEMKVDKLKAAGATSTR